MYTESCRWACFLSLCYCRCDRILWRGKGLKQVQYETCSYRLSDHRPVRAVFHAECDALSEAVSHK
jgi:hypothetical protein